MTRQNLPYAGKAEPIHVRFDRVAQRYSGQVALTSGERTVTYGGLRDSSDTLARRLRRQGVGIETPVGVLAHRSIAFVTAALAVLKAGGTYVPLSPEYPADRLRHLVVDSDARLVLTTPEHADQAARYGRPVLDVEGRSDQATTDGPDPDVLALPEVPADCLAYLIYTSGSTGTPKGVGVTHRNLTGLVTHQKYVDFGPDETFLQLAPTSFDASAWEIWGALLSGARLVIASPSYQAVEELPTVLGEQQVTTLLLTPPLFHELARTRLDSFASVRQLIVGGEAMAVPVAGAYAADARRRHARFANVYGPTETTTLVSWHSIDEVAEDETSIPIGRPIGNATIRLLDARLRPVRVGETGEIYISGSCVTRGYHGLPGLTARRFVPDPHASGPGARMYATGDLGLLRTDGEIEFVGRTDEQVKVRGHRVEPGEVESVIMRHHLVHNAAVVANRTENDTWQLVAHIVPIPGADAPQVLDAVRDITAVSLPPYMVPSAYRVTDALPTTPGGKLDRARLMSVRADPMPTSRSLATPESAWSETQRTLAAIWRTLLDVPEVGLDEDFFALGGNSILAIRVIAAAEEIGIEIPLTTLFGTPTIREILPASAPAAVGPAPAHPAPTRPTAAGLSPEDHAKLPEDVECAYPATSMQLGLIFESTLDEDGSLYHDVISRHIQGAFDEELFRRALDLVAAAHPILRTRFSLGDFSVPLQLVGRETAVPLTVVHRDAGSADPEAPEEDILDAARRFDPMQGPLIRLRVSTFGDNAFQLTYGFHHAIMDGWSESVFAAELLTAYAELLSTGTATVAAEPKDGYPSFVELEQAAVESAASRAFWTERLRSVPRIVHPHDAPRSAERINVIETLPSSVHRGLTKAQELTQLPFKSLVLAAHLAALGVLRNITDPVTGVAMNGRPETHDGDRLIGLFLNLLPLQIDLGGTWADLARKAFDQERGILPHRRFPYAALHEMAGGAPFDVSFNYVQFHERSRLSRLGDITVGDADIRDQSSHPLRVEVVQEPDSDLLDLAVAADPRRWSPAQVQNAVAAHVECLERLAGDPTAPAMLTGRR
ncbi:non-ribosomal peptide synthetase [Salinispora arenicola]|uniref:non-ribosomal peptide synthetase n=1 Tax=Salinispora arenicola TaxID=168697 RepID=UPI00036BDA07|nr:non-ribosomal peptide synthetase [Salinispora arenicola]